MCRCTPLPPSRESSIAMGARKPDRHLVLELAAFAGRARSLVDALLRVDIGARIDVDEAANRVVVEGRFDDAELMATLAASAFRLVGMEDRPVLPKRFGGAQWMWG